MPSKPKQHKFHGRNMSKSFFGSPVKSAIYNIFAFNFSSCSWLLKIRSCGRVQKVLYVQISINLWRFVLYYMRAAEKHKITISCNFILYSRRQLPPRENKIKSQHMAILCFSAARIIQYNMP